MRSFVRSATMLRRAPPVTQATMYSAERRQNPDRHFRFAGNEGLEQQVRPIRSDIGQFNVLFEGEGEGTGEVSPPEADA